MSSTFDWSRDGAIICHHQPALAVYPNPYGQVVIRQERDWDGDDDPCIPVGHAHVVALIYAMLDAAGLSMELVQRVDGEYRDVARPDCAGSAPRAHNSNTAEPQKGQLALLPAPAMAAE